MRLWTLSLAVLVTLVGPANNRVFASGFIFSKIADHDTMAPEKSVTFSGFGEPSLYGENIAFIGVDSEGAHGIYLCSGLEIEKIVDNNTPVPGGSTSFFEYYGSEVSLDGENVAFYGHHPGPLPGSVQGIFAFIDGVLQIVADGDTMLPGGVGTFKGFNPAKVSIDGSDVVFVASRHEGPGGVFARVDGAMIDVANTDDPVPGGSHNFSGFVDLSIENGTVAFKGTEYVTINRGIYLGDGGPLTVVADVNTPIPGDVGRVHSPVLDKGRVAFLVGGEIGVYLYADGSITKLLDCDTPILDADETVASIGRLSFYDDKVAFNGRDSAGVQSIFLYSGGVLEKVIDENDSLEGRAISYFNLGKEGLSGNSVAFVVCFRDDNTDGLYVVTHLPILGDINGDCMVNDLDAAILATYWQYEGMIEIGWEHGDFNGDGKVTDADAAILATHWQESVGEQATSVPGPSTAIALLSMAVVGLVAYSWRNPLCQHD